ncbi:MAG: hypothetical protein U0793_07475 [Gemmataceae bacterium]
MLTIIALLSGYLSLLDEPALGAAVPPTSPLVLEKHEGWLYVAIPGRIDIEHEMKGEQKLEYHMMYSTLLHRFKAGEVQTFEFPCLSRLDHARPNWRLDNDLLLVSAHRYSHGAIRVLPLKRLQAFSRVPKDAWTKMAQAEKDRITGLRSFFAPIGFDPLQRMRSEHWMKVLGEKFNFAAADKAIDTETDLNDYAFGGKELLLFTICQKSILVHTARLGKDGNRFFPEWDDTPKHMISSSFSEPFRAYAVGADYFFVTDSGEAYAWRRPGNAKQELEPIWHDRDQPIRAVYVDEDTKRTYVFIPKVGARTDEESGSCIEFGERCKAKDYRLDPGKEGSGTPSMLRRALQYSAAVIPVAIDSKARKEK